MAELVGGTTVAKEIIEAAVKERKSIVTANKELMALAGAELWDSAIKAGINLAMEASVAGGIPIHAVLREGISGDRVTTLFGILNGTSNFILTEIEKRRADFDDVLAEAQQPRVCGSRSHGRHRRLRCAIKARDPFGARVWREDHAIRYLHGWNPPHSADRFPICAPAGAHDPAGLRREADARGPDSFRAARADPDFDDYWRACRARTTRYGSAASSEKTRSTMAAAPARIRRCRGCERSDACGARDPQRQSGACFAVRASAARRIQADPRDVAEIGVLSALPCCRPAGIIAALSKILAEKHISLDAVLQLPSESKDNLPFVITVEPTSEKVGSRRYRRKWRNSISWRSRLSRCRWRLDYEVLSASWAGLACSSARSPRRRTSVINRRSARKG